MTEYLLAMAVSLSGPPRPIGAIFAVGSSGAVWGEAVVGEGDIDLNFIDAAVDLFRTLPGPREASGSEWLAGLAGISNGLVRLTGPWSWDAQEREVLHWSMSEAGLTARTVAIVRDGRVVASPSE